MSKNIRKKSDILKKIPNYTKNVAKSTFFSSMDIIKEIAPEVSEFAESSSRIVQSAMTEGRQYGSNVSSFLKNYKNSQIYKEAQQAKKEAIEDLKSGKFYNKDRDIEKANKSIMDDDKSMLEDLGFDFSDSNGNLSDEEIINKMMGGGGSTGKDKPDTPQETIAPVVNNISINSDPSSSIRAIGQSAQVVSGTVLNSSQYVVDNQNAIYTMQSITSHKMFAEVSERLHQMTGYVKGLFDYTQNISNYFEASMSYYDKTMDIYQEMKASQKELTELTRTIGGLTLDSTDSDSDEIKHKDIFRGGLDINSYIKNIKENVSSNAGLFSSMIDSAKMSADTAGKSFTSMLFEQMNPARLVSKHLANKFIVDPIKDNLQEFNTTFSSFFKGLSLKGKRISSENNNPIFSFIYKLLGVDPDDEKSIDNSTKEGFTRYNNYADKAITDVIPTYLRKILSAITGKGELVYDYTTGKFKSIESIQKSYDKDLENIKGRASSDLSRHASDVFDAAGLSYKEKNKMGKKFSNFLNFFNDNELFFNPYKDTYDKFNNHGIASYVDKEDFDIFKNIVLSSKDKGISMNDIVYNTRDNVNDFIDRKNKALTATGDSSLFNGTNDGSGIGLVGSILNTVDSTGTSIFNYIKDIKEILLEGIFVYSVSTKSNANVSSRPGERLEEYRNRLNKARSKTVGGSNSGKDTYGEDYISPSERGNIDSKMGGLSPDSIVELLNSKREKKKETEENNTEKDNRSIIGTLTSNIKSLADMPMQFVNNGIKYMDVTMKRILYGKDSQVFSFFDNIKKMIDGKFDDVRNSFKEKIFDPLEEKLFGENGIITKFESWFKDKMSIFGSKIKNVLLGQRDNYGAFRNGIFSSLANYGLDSLNMIKRFATGKGYRSLVSGKEIEDLKGGSLFSFIKDGFANMKSRFAEKLFGKVIDTDENGDKIRSGDGLINKIRNYFMSSLGDFKDKYIGKSISTKSIKENIPKVLKGAGIGMSIGLWSSMFLPIGIGIVPGLLLGGATSFAKNNESIQKFLFGNGEKGGLLGGQKIKEAIDKYMPSMLKGFGIGSLAGILTGNPVLGPILGASIGFATKSNKFKEYLFGKDGDDSEALIKQETLNKIKSIFPKSAAIATGAFLYKSLGFLGSSLLPGGIIGASLFGFATAMMSNSETVKKFLFGDIDKLTGKRDKSGLLGRMSIWFKYNFVEEIKFRLFDISTSFKLWFKDKIGNKLKDAFKPIFEEIKLVGKKILGFFANSINKVFEKSVGMPLGQFMNKTLLGPLKKLFGGFFNVLKKTIELPFGVVGKMGNNLAEKHRRMGLEYTKDYFKNKNMRDSKVKEDKTKFKKEKADRREKLSFLQSVLSKFGYNIKNKNVKDAMDDFENKYKNGKWREFEISTYKSVNAIHMEEQKQTSILDQIKGFGKSVADYISIKTSHLKDKMKYNKDMVKDKISGKYEDIKSGYNNYKNKIHEDRIKAGKKFKDSASESFKGWKMGIFEAISNSLNNGTNIFNNKVKEESVKGSNFKMYKNGTAKIKSERPEEINVAEERRKNIKEGKYSINGSKVKEDGKREKSLLGSINRHIKAIDREISGQLSGVGWNLDAIRKILAKVTGIDAKGNPIRGNKSRSIFGNIKNLIMRPVDFITDVIGNIKDKIVGTITSTIKGGVSIVTNTLKSGVSLISTTLKTLGTVISEGAKIVGGVLVESTKVLGTLLQSSITALGSILDGLLTGVGKLGGALLSGIGSLANGIAKASGHVIAGLGKFTGSLIKAGGYLVDGVIKLTKNIAVTAYKGVKQVLSGLGSLIKAPFKFIGSKIGKITGVSKGYMTAQIINFSDLLSKSKNNPLWVNVANISQMAAGGEDYTINTPINNNKDLGDNVIPVDFGGPKNPTPNVTDINAKIVNWNEMGPVQKILDILKSKYGNKEEVLPSQSKSLGKVNNNVVESMSDKIFTNAESDVNSYAKNVSNIRDFDFIKASNDITKMKSDKVVSAKAMAQTAEASKGTFAFLAKHGKKGGILSKIGTLLMLGLPAIMKFFKNLKSGKWIGKLASKLFGKGSLFRFIGSNVIKGLRFVGTGIKSLVELFAKTKIGQSLIGTGGKVLDKILGPKEKIVLPNGQTKVRRKGVLGRGLDKIKTAGQSGIDKIKNIRNKRKNKGNVVDFQNVKNKKHGSLVKPIPSTKGTMDIKRANGKKKAVLRKSSKIKNVASTIANIGAEMSDQLVNNNPISNLDLSNIDNAFVINGNVLLHVNGNVLGGSGAGVLPSGINPNNNGGGGNPLLDIAEDKVSEKLSRKIVNKGEKKALKQGEKKAESKVINFAERKTVKNVENSGEKAVIKSVSKHKPHLGKKGKLALLGGITTLGATSLMSRNVQADDNQSNNIVGDLALDTATNASTEIINNKLTNAVANKTGGNVIDFASKTGKSVAGKVTKDGSIMGKISSLVSKICNSGVMQKIFGKNAGILPKVGEWVIKKFSRFGVRQLTTVLSKLTSRLAGGLASAGVIPAVFAAYDGISGMVEVRRIFKLDPDAPVTTGMRIATGLAKAVSNNLTFGLIDSSDIANFIYGLVASSEDKDKLKNGQKGFEDKYNKYVEEQKSKGASVQDFDTWNESKNKGFFGQAKDAVVNGVKGVGNAIAHPLDTLKNVKDWGVNKFNSVKETGKNIINKAKETGKGAIDFIKSGPSGWFNWGKDKIKGAKDWALDKAKGAKDWTVDKIKGIGNSISTAYKGFKSFNIGLANTGSKLINSIFGTNISLLDNNGNRIPKDAQVVQDPNTGDLNIIGPDGNVIQASDKVKQSMLEQQQNGGNGKGFLGNIGSRLLLGGLMTKGFGMLNNKLNGGNVQNQPQSLGQVNNLDQNGLVTQLQNGTVIPLQQGNMQQNLQNGIVGSPISPLQGITGGMNSSFVINGNATIEVNGKLMNGQFGSTLPRTQLGGGVSPFGSIDLHGGEVNLGTISNNLTNDAGILMSPPKNMPIEDQFKMLSDIRSQSNKLIEKSSTAAQLTMAKANDAIKNTATSYSDLASTAMNSTMNMATINSTNSAASYSVSQPPEDGTSASVEPPISVGTPPAKVQSQSTSLFSTIKNVASSVVSGVSKLFGFGGGNGGTSPSASSSSQTPPGNSTSNDVVNGMVYFNQNEEPWASKPYNSKGQTGKTIKTSGCGVTSAAMVISSLTGKAVTPEEAANWSMAHNFKDPDAGTKWGFFDAFGKQYGVGFKDISTNGKALVDGLKAKQPAILSGRGSAPFTRGGHFVVAAGLDNNGNVLINDPNHRSNNKAFSVGQLQSAGWQNGWVADKALSGNLPTIPGGTAGPGSATPGAQEQPSSPLDILGKIGSTLVDASSSILMGRVYEPNQQVGGDATGGSSNFTGTGTGVFGGSMGTAKLPAGVLKWKDTFNKEGAKYGVEPETMEAIAAQESGGDANNSNGYALGLMQIENTLASEFASFGKKTTGTPFTLADRADPTKAIPFATSRFGDDLKHYKGDYLKTIQAYNFSKYSLDMLLKKYPNDWMSHRKEMGSINGVGGSYGDAQYIEHVMRYYYGKIIKQGAGNGEGMTDAEMRKASTDELRERASRILSLQKMQKQNVVLGGNGGDDGTTHDDRPQANVIKFPRPKVNKYNYNGNNRTESKVIEIGSIKAQPPKEKVDNIKVEDFASSSMSSMSNRIDNLLFAKQSAEQGTSSGMELKEIVNVLNKISDNTAQTAQNTKEISEKDFKVNHNYENTYETKQEIDNSTKNVNMKSTNNPFIEAANSQMKPMSGYEFAKRIAEK